MSQGPVESDRGEGTAEAALRASEERLRVAQAAGGVGTFEYIPDGERMLVSSEFCRIWGVEVVDEAPIGFFMGLIHPDDHDRVEAAHGPAAEDGLGPTEYRIVRPDTGEIRWPVLIVSGYAELDGLPPDRPRLTKPFRQADLADCVAALREVTVTPLAVDTICDNRTGRAG